LAGKQGLTEEVMSKARVIDFVVEQLENTPGTYAICAVSHTYKTMSNGCLDIKHRHNTKQVSGRNGCTHP
jgi:hypothetical protein